ncbi:MAG TPA: NAD(+) diphosphatase [Caulobacteraceae bacterium]|nr:NAD(+) diphosphatase [Caulobacteraceae bacterium]
MRLHPPLNTYAGNPLDRAADRRADAAWLEAKAADPASFYLAFWNKKPLVEPQSGAKDEGLQVAYLAPRVALELAPSPEDRLFLGLWKDTPVFAVEISGDADPSAGALAGMGQFEELRAATPALSDADAAILATAKAVFEWRSRHRFCAACGEESETAEGGWKRQCPACRAEHFPRTDPVVIMLAIHEDRCLLGRQAAWPKKMYSALAGFLEPGETIEEACARELLEEAGLVATEVWYHSSQPWPYPSSLMIGLMALVSSDEAAPDQTELEEVRWFTKDDIRAVLAGHNPDVRAPMKLAIARTLLEAWVAE